MAVDRQRHATRRQQETTQAREARCVYPSLGMCIRVCVYPSCARWLVAKKFGCKRAHINYYDNNTHEAGQSLPASRGADGRTTITRLTSTYEHSECIQTRRLGLPPPKKHHLAGRGNAGQDAAAATALLGHHHAQVTGADIRQGRHRLSSTCGTPRNHTNFQAVDAHV